MNRLQKFIVATLIASVLGCTPAGKEAVNADEPTQPQQPQSVLPSNLRDSLPPTQAEREAQAANRESIIQQAKQELYDIGYEYCVRINCPNPEEHAQELIKKFDYYGSMKGIFSTNISIESLISRIGETSILALESFTDVIHSNNEITR
jgi:hypothetical protein